MKRVHVGAALLALLVSIAASAASQSARSHYLLAHFTGESAQGEQIYFSVSSDGERWTDLNSSKPVLVSSVGEKGVRDPSIIRSANGDKFYILATDLRIASKKGWDAAMHKGSTSIVIFESSDLVNWSAPRLVNVAGTIPQAGCAWAPEAIYDEESGDYIVYWSTISPAGGKTKSRVYYSRTRDFVKFTPAQLYIDRPGDDGLIDTQIVKDDNPASPYRYYRASGDGEITIEGSDRILGDWKTLGNLRPVGLTGKDVEGPILFRNAARAEWRLWVDQYATGAGYLALGTADLSRPATFRLADPAVVSFGASLKRHGSILNVTEEEYRRVQAKWPAAKMGQPIAKRFNADPSPHYFDGMWYLYATDDASNSGKYWDSTAWRLYTSKDLQAWTDAGAPLDVTVFAWARPDAKAWAPEAAYRNGKYYFYAPVGGDKIGVAVADNPRGPFTDARGDALVDKARDANAGDEPIDPAVYVDGAGQAYMYFGTRVPKVVKLKADMVTLDGPILDVKIEGLPPTDPKKMYGEAPFLHKRAKRYYFTFSTGWPGQIVYATGESPLGPFTYRGVVLDYLDISTNHQAIVEHEGTSYLFYHDKLLPGGDSHRRSIAITPLEYGSDGGMRQVKLRNPN
jgi:beta-xylosidase